MAAHSVMTLEEMYAKFRPYIYHVCLGRLRNREAAEDATQETFLKAWKSLASFRGDAHPRTWLHAIALNESSLRARKSHPQDISLDQMLGWNEAGEPEFLQIAAPDRYLELMLVHLDAQRCIRRSGLSQRQWESLDLWLAGLTMMEIAEVIGASLSAAKARAWKARAKVCQSMRRRERSA